MEKVSCFQKQTPSKQILKSGHKLFSPRILHTVMLGILLFIKIPEHKHHGLFIIGDETLTILNNNKKFNLRDALLVRFCYNYLQILLRNLHFIQPTETTGHDPWLWAWLWKQVLSSSDSMTPWTVAHGASAVHVLLKTQEHWSGLPYPPPGVSGDQLALCISPCRGQVLVPLSAQRAER